MIDCVAQRLNNTRTVCRKSYIHPGVIEAFLDNSLPKHYQAVVRRRDGHRAAYRSRNTSPARFCVRSKLPAH